MVACPINHILNDQSYALIFTKTLRKFILTKDIYQLIIYQVNKSKNIFRNQEIIIKMSNKTNKKQMESQIQRYHNRNNLSERNHNLQRRNSQKHSINNHKNNQSSVSDKDSLNDFQLIMKETNHIQQKYNHKTYGLDLTTIEEVKTIANLIIQKKTAIITSQFNNKIELFVIENNINTAKIQALQQNMKQYQNTRNNINDKTVQTIHHKEVSKLQQNLYELQNQLQKKSTMLFSEDKILHLQNNVKRITDNLEQMINFIQNKFISRDQFQNYIAFIQQQANQNFKGKNANKKSPSKQKNHIEQEVHQISPAFLEQINKQIEKIIKKNKNQENKQYYDFKQKILKETSHIVKLQTVQNLLEINQTETMQKIQLLTKNLNNLESKIQHLTKSSIQSTYFSKNKNKQTIQRSKNFDNKQISNNSSQRSIEAISCSLINIEKAFKKVKSNSEAESKRVELLIHSNTNQIQNKLMSQLQKREKFLCELIEENCQGNNTKVIQMQEYSEIKKSLNVLFSNFVVCRYEYLGSKECKKDDLIAWERQKVNTMPDIFCLTKSHAKDEFNFNIGVAVPGIYRVEVFLYKEDAGSEAYLLLNGDVIGTIQRKENTKLVSIQSRGAVFHQPIIIPTKSQISVRVNSAFYGNAYLQIHKI